MIDLDAYDLYLRARAQANQRNRGRAIQAADTIYHQVIAKDPSFAPAYAGLASAYAAGSQLHCNNGNTPAGDRLLDATQ